MSKESTAFVRSKLVNYTEADCSDENVENNRVHYRLRFTTEIGFSWLQSQVSKLNHKLDVTLELWEIHPSGVNDFEVDVREIERREGIDDSQHGLDDF
jgi:hypothetical protein